MVCDPSEVLVVISDQLSTLCENECSCSCVCVHVCVTDGVVSYWSQYVQNDSPSSKSLAGLVVQLLQFQEDAFGRRVNNPALTKLPVST